MDKEYDKTPDIQDYPTKTKILNTSSNNEYKSKVFDILEKTHNIERNLARMKDALYELPKTIAKPRNPPLTIQPAENEESEEKSDDLQGQGVKNIIPTNIIDIYTR